MSPATARAPELRQLNSPRAALSELFGKNTGGIEFLAGLPWTRPGPCEGQRQKGSWEYKPQGFADRVGPALKFYGQGVCLSPRYPSFLIRSGLSCKQRDASMSLARGHASSFVSSSHPGCAHFSRGNPGNSEAWSHPGIVLLTKSAPQCRVSS